MNINIFNAVFIILASYFGVVFYYLRFLTNKYMRAIDRSELLKDKPSLRTNQQVRDEYADKDVINILVLTGGGVRGKIPLEVLNKLEQLTNRKTGELFDFMAGASTGAINCAILSVPDGSGGCKFAASDIIHNYASDVRRSFSAPWYHQFLTGFGLFGPRYLPEGKAAVLDSYLGDLTLADLPKNIMVPVYDLADNSLKIIRNWEPARHGYYPNYLLRDVIQGASNPPFAFAPSAFSLGVCQNVFIDPGVVVNNPAEIALLNTWLMFPNKKLRLVLIGNGGDDSAQYNYKHVVEFGAYGLLQYLLNSPIISSKLSTDLVREHLYEAKENGLSVDFIYINTDGGHTIAAGDSSENNLDKVALFAERLIAENMEQIEQLAYVLTT